MLKPNENLKNIKPYHTDEYEPECILKLDSNENIFGPSKHVLNAFKDLNPKMFNFYPCYGKMLDILSKTYKLDKTDFLLTNGCDEAINIVLSTYLLDGQNVVSFSPTFSMPYIYTKILGREFNFVKYPDKWSFSKNELLKTVDFNTKIIYLCSPNNPTGDIIRPKIVLEIAKECKDKLILLDLTYAGYSHIDINDYFALLNECKNLVCVKSFSKDFALAGLRLGFIAANENFINEFRKLVSPFSVNSMALYAGIKSLEDTSWFENVKKEVVKNRQYLFCEFEKLDFVPYKSEANFILVDFGAKADFIYTKLLNNGIIVRKFSDESLKTCLRISIPEENDAKKIVEILAPKNLLVFDLDGVVFDVSNSYRFAIEKTFEHFAGFPCKKDEIQDAKNLGGLSNDWDLTKYLLDKYKVKANYNDLVNVFKDIFYNPEKPEINWAIDNEKLVLDENFFKTLSKKYNLAVFTGRPREEAFYSLKKFNIYKYFDYFVCLEDVPEGKSKPYKDGLVNIKKHCLYNDICFFGDTVDDIKSGQDADVKTFGIIPPNALNVDNTKKCLIDCGAAGVIDNAKEILNYSLFREEEKCK